MDRLITDQEALGFLISQTAHIEPAAYRTKYASIRYPGIVPVDTDAHEWATGVVFYSMDMTGKADWFSAESQDMPFSDVSRSEFTRGFEMAAIGYRYNLQEVSVAARIPGTRLNPDRAIAARRAYEEFIDKIVFQGDATKGWEGLLNSTAVTSVNAPNGAGGHEEWNTKTAEEIFKDVNTILTGMWTATKQIELADTLLIPPEAWTHLVSTPRSSTSDITIMEWLMRANAYTAETRQPLNIRSLRGLEDAGAGNVGRVIAYRNSRDVLKLHLPMPHRFMPVWQQSYMTYHVPGIFRTGGLEIRLPGAVRYMDRVTT